MELRPTAPADLRTLHAVFLEAVASVFTPLGLTAPEPPIDSFVALQQHLLETGTSVVAVEDGEVVGFAAAWMRGDDWFLASLFVRPHAHGRRVGSTLLESVWCDAPRRRTITDAVQPVSNALYGRRGLVPVTPVLTFAGLPQLDERADQAEVDLSAVDAAAYGFDRSVDHSRWEAVARRATWPDAYSYVFPSGDVGPVAGATPAAAARALAAELSRAERPVRVRVLGSARETVEVCLRAGLRLGPAPGLLLTSRGADSPTAVVPSGYALL